MDLYKSCLFVVVNASFLIVIIIRVLQCRKKLYYKATYGRQTSIYYENESKGTIYQNPCHKDILFPLQPDTCCSGVEGGSSSI